MKKLFFIVCLLIGTLCKAQVPFIEVLPKDCVYTVPVKRVVVMDDRTFGKYHYYREHYDTLKELVKSFDIQLEKADSLNREITASYQSIISSKEEQITTCRESYGQMKLTLETSVAENKAMQIEFIKLEEKYKKKKRWNRFFKVACTVFVASTVFLVISK